MRNDFVFLHQRCCRHIILRGPWGHAELGIDPLEKEAMAEPCLDAPEISPGLDDGSSGPFSHVMRGGSRLFGDIGR
jgi:hypothetical protein